MTRMARGSMSTVYPGAGESLAGFDDRPGPVTVCRQSISDSWLGNLREYLAHLV
jgi:hypothetical protein